MRTTLKFELLNLHEQGYHLLVEAIVNGRNCRLILDTGASKTVMDQERALTMFNVSAKGDEQHEAAGLGTNKMQASIGIIKNLTVGKIKKRKFLVGLLDLSHVNSTYNTIGIEAIDGILGCDLLKKHKAIINFDRKTISFWKP